LRSRPKISLVLPTINIRLNMSFVPVNRQAICMDNSAAAAGEGLSAGVEGSGLQSTGASQHATGLLVWRYIHVSPSLLLAPSGKAGKTKQRVQHTQ